jgi:hypothetical protein
MLEKRMSILWNAEIAISRGLKAHMVYAYRSNRASPLARGQCDLSQLI